MRFRMRMHTPLGPGHHVMSSSIVKNRLFESSIFLCVISIILNQGLVKAQQDDPQTSKPSFLSDLRLNSVIDADVVGIPLKQFLLKCSQKEVRLEAVKNCENLKIQAKIKHRDLKTVMIALAELYQGEWVASQSKGYYFTLSSRTTAMQNQWWKLYEAERENEIIAIKRNMIEETTQEFAGNPASENEEDKRAVNVARKNHNFFLNLPRSLVETISERLNLDHCYNGNTIRNVDDEGAFPVILKDLPVAFTEYVQNERPYISMESKRTLKGIGSLGLEFIFFGTGIYVNTLSTNAPFPSYLVGDNFQNADLYRVALTPYHDGIISFLKEYPKYSTPRLQLLAKYYKNRVWNNVLPVVNKKYLNFNLIRPARWQKLRWVTEKGGAEFISDYHATFGYKMSEAEMKQPMKRTLEEELNELSVLHDLSWKKTNNSIYLVKNNKWYRDDYMEVPSEYLVKLRKAELPNTIGEVADSSLKTDIQAKSGVTIASSKQAKISKMRLWLDRAADIVANLSPWQIGKGLKYYVPEDSKELADSLKMLEQRQMNLEVERTSRSGYRGISGLFLQDAEYILARYRTILFYSSLSKANRTKLLGEGLPFEELNADQRDRSIWILPKIEILLKQGDEGPKILEMQPISLGDSYIPGKLVLKETSPTGKESVPHTYE